MNSRIYIALWDSDLFLLQGLKYIFTSYFQARNITIIFIPIASSSVVDLSVIDLVIGGGSIDKRNRYERNDLSIVRHTFWLGDFYQHREIGRREKPEVVIHLLDELFNAVAHSGSFSAQFGVRISLREREVLHGISKELTPFQIASRLNISIKTVSAHKRMAMRKLGFKNTNELYKWLLEGGLNMVGCQ
jgi:DNA-binding CsgD family transcriptional regulator